MRGSGFRPVQTQPLRLRQRVRPVVHRGLSWRAFAQGRHGALFVSLCVLLAVFAQGCRRDARNKRIEARAPMLDVFERAHRSLVRLDVDGARQALDAISEHSLRVDQLRARLALMVGDCQGALTLLTGHDAAGVRDKGARGTDESSDELRRVAEGCARAMAGAEIVNDSEHEVWIRLQNSHDRALTPLIVDTVKRATNAIARDLRTTLPRPVRVELVADLASLSAVTGLPLEAAETTGTVAIARWGKITMVSPRATPSGYPWQDTLAHELTHLVVSRASMDAAPLWLQEGIAKREETRWRDGLPFDDEQQAHREAKSALIEGRSVGIDRLGPSMALLPTARAAETAYSEVRDFLDYWLAQNGDSALVLLLHDLAGLGPHRIDRALSSVSGYTLKDWIRKWQAALRDEAVRDRMSPNETHVAAAELEWTVDAARRLRMAELFSLHEHFAQASEQLTPLFELAPMPPELAVASAQAQLMLGRLDEARAFVEPTERVTYLDGTWLAMRGRILGALGQREPSERAFRQSLAFAPTLQKVACRGLDPAEIDHQEARAPELEPWRSLCRSARTTLGQTGPASGNPWIN